MVLFLAAGILLFALDALRDDGGASRQILVSSERIEWIADTWEAQANRPPTELELDALIDEWIREEILVREALRLGLERDDLIVRRRLAQKMEFVLQDRAAVGDPDDTELRNFFERESERYVEPSRTSFQHVFVSREVHGENASDEAGRLLETLEQHPDDGRWRGLGDPFMLRREYALRSERELSDLFGRELAAGLRQVPIGEWVGPLPSALGLHLVRVLERTEPGAPDFESVRADVLADWRADARREANQRSLEELQSGYLIEVEERQR